MKSETSQPLTPSTERTPQKFAPNSFPCRVFECMRWDDKVREVEVIRETPKLYFVMERVPWNNTFREERRYKDKDVFYQTADEAWQHIVEKQRSQVTYLATQADAARIKLQRMELLSPIPVEPFEPQPRATAQQSSTGGERA